MKTVFDYIKFAEKKFPGDNLKVKKHEAEVILTEILNLERIDLYTKPEIEISINEKKQIENFFERKIEGEPVQYILGYAYFRNLKLSVNENVLIPRPETELLVNKALKLIKTETSIVIDVGTGSGAIALSIAEENRNAEVYAVDISSKALEIAKRNSILNKIQNVKFLNSSLCSFFQKNFADIIVANLPYVTEEEYNNLDESVSKFEPKLALHGGFDGLDLVRILIQQSINVLKNCGWILLEIGFTQGKKTIELFETTGSFRNIEIIKDMNGKDRIVLAQKYKS